MKKITVIGHFAFGKELLNGQTIKTKIIATELENQLGANEVERIDTYGGKKVLPKLFFKSAKALKTSKNVVILPAHNGIRFFVPVLSFFNRFHKRKLFYIVIGGWLPQYLQDKKRLEKQLKRFDGIFVETNTMKNALESMGFTNVFVMPNCKPLQVLKEEELVLSANEPYKLCTFSRVSKEKGIEDAVNVVKAVNDTFGRTVYTLDIYGQVDGEQTEWFASLRKDFPAYIQYGGLVPFDESVDVLKNYFALLFPTYYEGEGFAGTLIDAYSAGVPVIASDWKYNVELVDDNIGCIYPTGDQLAFIDILKTLAINPMLFICKKQSCLKEADKYQPKTVVGEFLSTLDSLS